MSLAEIAKNAIGICIIQIDLGKNNYIYNMSIQIQIDLMHIIKYTEC